MKKEEIIIDAAPSNDSNRKRRKKSSRGSSSNGRNPRKGSNDRAKAIVITLIIIIALSLSIWGVSALWNMLMNANIGGNSGPVEVEAVVDDKVTCLLGGTDSDGYNTDTIMLAMLDCKTRKVSIMSIPRDTRVPNPYGGKGYSKINSVYYPKGMTGLIKQVTEITQIPINYYCKINFKAFREVIDLLGGVDFNVPERLKYDDPAQNLHIDLYPGMQHLNGDKAEQLVRCRNTYPTADLQRTAVQRDFIKATIEQHANLGTLTKLQSIYSAIEPSLETNVKVGDALKYAGELTKITDENINLMMLPGEANEFFYYYPNELQKIVTEDFGYDVTIKATPKPNSGSSNSNSGSTTTHTPTRKPTPKPTATAEPNEATSTPQATKKPNPTSTPTPTSTPDPTVAPTRTPTVAPTKSPGETNNDYPDGV